mgnify:CR=1 FL=1
MSNQLIKTDVHDSGLAINKVGGDGTTDVKDRIRIRTRLSYQFPTPKHLLRPIARDSYLLFDLSRIEQHQNL